MTATLTGMDENLRQIVEGLTLEFIVGDGKKLNCSVAKTGLWSYSGSRYVVLEFKPCAGVKGFLRLDTGKLGTFDRLNQAVAGAFENRFALVEYCKSPQSFSNAVKTWTDWGNGWQWEEGRHDSQAKGFRCEAGTKSIRIQKAHNNHMPTDVAYFSKDLKSLPYVNTDV
jgi:hypothetical protein